MNSENNKKPVVAICYDFDKTLTPDDMQAQGYIQSVYKGDVSEFWKESNQMAEKDEMDSNLAYMYKMVQEAHGTILLNRNSLTEYGKKVELYPGVESWFDRLTEFGREHQVTVEHYIISSGLKEMIEGTKVADKFKKIYACAFKYDEKDVPVWPAQVVNFTNKTQFLFRIAKGTLDVNDSRINDPFKPEDYRVPFRNIVYIGDSDTDVPCMKLVNVNGGHSIGVYDKTTNNKSKVYKMLHDNRIKYYAPADYNAGSELDQLVKTIIKRTASNEELENIHYFCVNDMIQNNVGMAEINDKNDRITAIASLEGSKSFASTHAIIKELNEIENWDKEDCKKLIHIGLKNTQVKYILNDDDVKMFYVRILNQFGESNDQTQEIEKQFKD